MHVTKNPSGRNLEPKVVSAAPCAAKSLAPNLMAFSGEEKDSPPCSGQVSDGLLLVLRAAPRQSQRTSAASVADTAALSGAPKRH